ncbi:MAG: hypothetical protein V7752_20960 [Halopseudomonas sp.]
MDGGDSDNKYQELAGLACSQAAETFAIKEVCERHAFNIAYGYQKFLEVPDEYFTILRMNSDLSVSGKEDGKCWPKLTRSNDGFGILVSLFITSYLKEISTQIKISKYKNRHYAFR